MTTSAGRISIHAPDLFEELVSSLPYSSHERRAATAQAAYDNGAAYQPRMGIKPSALHSQLTSAERRHRVSHQKLRLAALKEQYKQSVEEEDRRHQEYIQQRKQQKDQQFWDTIQAIEQGSTFTNEVSEFLQTHDQDSTRRKEKLFQEWMEAVYRPIQKQIEDQLANITTAQLESRRRAMFEAYIKTSNATHGRIFRDIIDKEQYDPFKLRGANLRYTATSLKDPCKRELDERDQELREGAQLKVRLGCTAPARLGDSADTKGQATLSRTGREVLDILKWDKLETTPYCRYEPACDAAAAKDHIQRNGVGIYPYASYTLPRSFGSSKSTAAVRPAQQCHIAIDHYNVFADAKVVKQEYFPRGKKVFPDKSVCGLDKFNLS